MLQDYCEAKLSVDGALNDIVALFDDAMSDYGSHAEIAGAVQKV